MCKLSTWQSQVDRRFYSHTLSNIIDTITIHNYKVEVRLKLLVQYSKRSMAAPTLISSVKCFGGSQKIFEHASDVLKCKMKFAVFFPTKADEEKVPVLYWLSGLTCTEQNFVTKAGAQRCAEKYGLMIVAPDTSPRGCGIEGEDDSWDFGTGAGFYVDATQEKWKTNYNMYSYITSELPAIVHANFPTLNDKQSVFGHSMGGHGALVCALKNPGLYLSVSAFAPICNPINCPWGQKAFNGYLGSDQSSWKDWDATELVGRYNGPPFPYILIDQGKEDNFLKQGQLLPENFVDACRKVSMPVVLRMQEEYDHSYYFIASYMEEHIKHHADILNA